jgi:WD40 repeat protein
VAASQDGTARVWDLSASPAIAPYRNDCGRAQVPVYGDGSSNSPDGRAHFRPGPDGGVLERHPVAPKALGHPGPVKASRFSADGTRLATFAGSAVRVWDATSGEPIGPPLVVADESMDVPRLELTSDGRRVAAVYRYSGAGDVGSVSAKRPAAVIVWEATGRRLFTLPARIESGPQMFGEVRFDGQVSLANLSPDGRVVAAAVDSSGELSVFEVDTGTRLHQTRAFRGYVHDVEFNPNGRTLIVASSDNLARELDTTTGKSAGPLLRHPSNPRSTGFSPDGQRVVTLTRDGGVCVWDLRTGDLLVNSAVGADRLHRCWFSQDGTTVQYFSRGNYWRLRLPTYAGPVEAVPMAVRLLTGRYLDEADVLEDLGPDEFIANRLAYRRAYLAWQGLPADPAVQP